MGKVSKCPSRQLTDSSLQDVQRLRLLSLAWCQPRVSNDTPIVLATLKLPRVAPEYYTSRTCGYWYIHLLHKSVSVNSTQLARARAAPAPSLLQHQHRVPEPLGYPEWCGTPSAHAKKPTSSTQLHNLGQGFARAEQRIRQPAR
jgi:hypothetical protein